MNNKQSDFIKTVPDRYKNTFKIAYSGESKATALKAKCLDCSNFDTDEIKNCLVMVCPIWAVRPYKSKTDND